MLLGALYRQMEVNPIDYVHDALNVKISMLEAGSPEHSLIHKYVENTSGSSISFSTHKVNIFEVQRKGEAENIAEYSHHGNHRLLFHGSSMFNFLGILTQGLRVAPPEAPTTGYAFGKGIYFADMFEKSYAYSQQKFRTQQSHLLLLCEVALGKMKEVTTVDVELSSEKIGSNF